MTEPVDTQNPAQDAVQSAASVSPVPADPVVVDAPPSAAAPGADIVGHSEQPLPGAQPGVVADTPVAAQTAADPHPEDSVKEPPAPDAIKAQSADDPAPEATAQGSTDPALHNPRLPLDAEPGVHADSGTSRVSRLEDAVVDEFDGGDIAGLDAADEFSDAHPSKQPVALRPTPAGPTSQQPARVQRAREENRDDRENR